MADPADLDGSPGPDASADDGFARVLELAQAVLDDPAADAGQLAARAFLSRFHFDRLIAAAAGEPPGALRRRLLLERAAFRLFHGGSQTRSVLDVAVEAGYSSHEAFTRAFVRAYGRTPTSLRDDLDSRPNTVRDLEIEGESGVHFQPPSGLRIPAARTVGSTDLVLQLMTHHVESLGRLIAVGEGLGESSWSGPIVGAEGSLDAEPGEAVSLRDVLNAAVTQEEHWLRALRGGDWPDESDRSPSGLAARHAAAGSDFLAFVEQALADGVLADTFIDTTCRPPVVYTIGGLIAHLITFGAVRRTTAVMALRSAGVLDSWELADPRPAIDAGEPATRVGWTRQGRPPDPGELRPRHGAAIGDTRAD